MMTRQKYGEGDAFANNLEQSVQKPTSSARSAAQSSQLSDDTVEIYSDVYQVQEQLLDVVDGYLQTLSPVAAINNLLEHWLTTPPADLSKEVNRKQVHVVLGLVTFLVNLKDCDDALKTSLAHKKEVSNE